MPSTLVVRQFTDNQVVHVTNRGVNKCQIFINAKDYEFFIYKLCMYLWSPGDIIKQFPHTKDYVIEANLHHDIKLVSYCLMPNHFHLLLHQRTPDAVTKLLHRLSIAYTKYFNQKYDRTGSLLQGPYRSTYPGSTEAALRATRYILLNPLKQNLAASPAEYPWSSIHDYMGNGAGLCDASIIHQGFNDTTDFLRYIETVQASDFQKT